MIDLLDQEVELDVYKNVLSAELCHDGFVWRICVVKGVYVLESTIS